MIIKNGINYIDINNLTIENEKFGKIEKPIEEGNEKNDYQEKEGKTNKVSKELYKNLLQNENCIFLTGAGVSVVSGGPIMRDLWLYFTAGFDNNSNDAEIEKRKTEKFFLNNIESYEDYKKEKYHEKFNEYAEKFSEKSNIEEFLSKLLIYIEGLKLDSTKTLEQNEVEKFKKVIENEFKKLCFINYTDESEYGYFLYFLTMIRGEKNKSRLKIFTLNYDTLFEQTASKYLYTIIDGFSFTNPRYFSSSNFDLDIIEKKDNRVENNVLHEKVFHLYKLHGSLNWKRTPEEKFEIFNSKYDDFNVTDYEQSEIEELGAIIYPGKSKYEDSYNMPFFEMLTRFQFELRKKETILNIIGYGFGDKHINKMIFEALKNNTSLSLNIFSSPKKEGGLYYLDEDSNFRLNDKYKELLPYIEMKRINIYNMKFWGLVNLLEVYKPDTLEQNLFKLNYPEIYSKLFPNAN